VRITDHGQATGKLYHLQQEIQSLKKQLWRAKRDNEILKKATAWLN
jgi:transposase-like protein